MILSHMLHKAGFQPHSAVLSVDGFEAPHDKTNNVVVRPAKTQISLGNRQV